ncbi:hypothetical protein [Marinomonas sp.]
MDENRRIWYVFLGIWFYGDPTSLLRYMGVLLIILGVVVLKFAH